MYIKWDWGLMSFDPTKVDTMQPLIKSHWPLVPEVESLLERHGDVVEHEVVVVVDAVGENNGCLDGDVPEHRLRLLHERVSQRALILRSLFLVHRNGDECVQLRAALDVAPPDAVHLVSRHDPRTQWNAV